MGKTSIIWTNATWNPVTGCTKHSTGCLHCYAESMCLRLWGTGMPKYANGFKLTLHPECLEEPKAWKKPCLIFLPSMGDLFHKDVPFEFIDMVMETIVATPQHRYQILTKRAERMFSYFTTHPIPDNVWLGVTVEHPDLKYRIDYLRQLPAKVTFLSCEPLVGDLGELNLNGIDWIIVGGESGPAARPMEVQWAINIRDQVLAANKLFLFKQWGTYGADHIRRSKKANGNVLEGHQYLQMPAL